MNKKLLQVAMTTALTVAFAVPAFANPFSDVPAKHWAYDAVNKLAKAGIVDGFNDNTFRGDKTITRYEMAEIVSRAMNKSMNSDQKILMDKLTKEYAVEINNLGVKVTGMQNQINDMVKLNGDARVRYYSSRDEENGNLGDRGEYRVRLGATAKINDDMTLHARLSSGDVSTATGSSNATVENAYVSAPLVGFNAKIGRQDYELGQGMLAGGDSIAIVNGVSVREGKFMAVAGKEMQDASTWAKSYAAQYSLPVGVPLTVDFLRLGSSDYYAASTNFKFLGLNMSGEYGRNQTDHARAYQIKAGIPNTGFTVAYKDIAANALPYETSNNLKATGPAATNDFYAWSQTEHVKGIECEYNKELAKNTNLNLLYQDIENHGKNVRATASVKF